MKTSLTLLAAIFLVLFLFSGSGYGPKMGEARMCSRASQKFRGVCMSKNNCENTCATEGYTAGDCHGVRRRCICAKPCV